MDRHLSPRKTPLAREWLDSRDHRLDRARRALLITVDGRRSGQFTVRRVLPEGYQVEHVTVVDTVLGPEVVPENQDGEVAALRTVSPEEVLEMVADGLFTLEAALSMKASLGAFAPVSLVVPPAEAPRVSL